MPRKYVPSSKHKHPKGFGSLCPSGMPLEAAQALLERAIVVNGLGQGKVWAAAGGWCFCAHPSPHAGDDAWHGFPVVGGEVDERVLDALEGASQITPRERRRLQAQRALPAAWP